MNPLALTYSEFAEQVARQTGKGHFHAQALYRAFFSQGQTDFSSVAQWSRYPREAQLLSRDLILPRPPQVHSSRDGTVKFVTSLQDGRAIESVIIPEKNRTTLCISSQAGCAMGCAFCATGQAGFFRDLSVEEIVGQVFSARFHLHRSIDNLVFMGMGEPLENLGAVTQALRVIADQRGLNIPFSHVTLSTAGHVDGIRQLARLRLPRIRLAVSLNAAADNVRSRIMPINRRYTLSELKAALSEYPLGKREVVFIEYVLLPDVNDSPEAARQLVQFLSGLKVRVNLIPFNACESLPFSTPSAAAVERFRGLLVEAGLFIRVRQPHGTAVGAACGQLAGGLDTATGMG